MSAASEALADVRGWLCDNLSEGDAGKACGMLSVVSRHIVELETENDNLVSVLHEVEDEAIIAFNSLRRDCETITASSQHFFDKWWHAECEVDRLKAENAKLRRLARGLNWCTENAKVPSAECEHCPLGDAEDGELSCEKLMCELGIEVR